MKNFNDYVIDIIDEDHILISNKIFSEFYDYTDREIIDLLGEESKDKNVLIIRHPDGNLDDGVMVDCSTYSLKIDNQYIDSEKDQISKEIWGEIINLLDYKKKYLSY